MGRTQYRYKKRAFLNNDKLMGGYIKASIVTNPKQKYYKDYIEADFVISDCSRSVYLDFSEFRSLQKAKLLQKIINEFVEKFEEEINFQKSFPKQPKPKKVKKKTEIIE